MDERFIQKMIRNCFLQYYDCVESIPLSKIDMQNMILKIEDEYRTKDETLHELVEDAVYEYVTK